MSSNDFQVVKKSRFVGLNPQTSGGNYAGSSTTKGRTIGSTRTGGNDNFVLNQGASSSFSGRELNRDALTSVRDRNQIPARGLGAAGSGTSSRTSQLGRAQVTTNVSMGGGYEQVSNDEVVRRGGAGRLRIDTEKVNIPTTSSEQYKFKSEYEKSNIPTRSSEQNKIRIIDEKVNIPTASSNERNKIKIVNEKVNIPVANSRERRKIKIETVKENIPKPVAKGRRRIFIEGEKEDQPEGNLRDRQQVAEKPIQLDKKTLKEQLIPIWIQECKVKDSGRFTIKGDNRRIKELEARIAELEKIIVEKDKEIERLNDTLEKTIKLFISVSFSLMIFSTILACSTSLSLRVFSC